jgi:hypothetical protein
MIVVAAAGGMLPTAKCWCSAHYGNPRITP